MRGIKNLPAAILIAFFLIFSTAAADVNDPVAHWKFDEGAGDTAYDSAGTNDGTVYDSIWTGGKVGGALDFNAIGYVEVPDDDSLNPADELSIAFWIYERTSLKGGVFKWAACPWQPGSPGNSRGYFLHVTDSPRQVLFNVNRSSSNGDTIRGIQEIGLNEWHHIAATFNRGQASIYVDGQLDTSETMSVSSIMNDAQPLTIGGAWSYYDGPQYVPRCDGLIDDVQIYDRALSAEEIWDLANPQIEVAVDIKPGACPNPLNLKSKGVVAVAVLGTEEFDVNTIDLASVRLEGVAAVRSNYEDVAAPAADGNECDCTVTAPDGYTDVVLKFGSKEIAVALLQEFGELEHNDVIPLILTGTLTDGSPIEGTDCVVIRGNVSRPAGPVSRNPKPNDDDKTSGKRR